jgi:hypothetical protein
MFRHVTLRSLMMGLGVAVIATACAPENISAPQAPLSAPVVAAPPAANASLGLLGGVLNTAGTLVTTVEQTVSGLLYPVVQRKVALVRPITVTRVIGASGGTISIPEAGLTVTFSRWAVPAATSITVTADAGKAVSYEFGPHGTKFNAPVTITQDMSLTTLADRPASASSIKGGYTANGLSDIVDGLLAQVAELLDASTTVVQGSDGSVHLGTSSFIIKHFSGYILIGA